MRKLFQQFLLFLFSFLLLWEWLRPLTAIVEIRDITAFVLFSSFSLFLSVFQVPAYVSFPLKVTAMVGAVYSFFYRKYALFDMEWLVLWIRNTIHNFQVVWDGKLSLIDDVFRTTLLVILLWLITFLLHYWIVSMKKSVLFILLTFVFLGLVDTFTTYDATVGIIRTTVVSLCLLAVLQAIRLEEETILQWDRKKWYAPLLLFVVFSLGLAFILPSFPSQWPDPLASWNENQYKKSKSGIDKNDESLGGPFEFNNEEVFKVKSRYPVYLRVEHKQTYTGKGWKSKPAQWTDIPFSQLSMQLYEQVEANQIPVEIFDRKKKESLFIPYPGEIADIRPTPSVSIKQDAATGRLEWESKSQAKAISRYEMTYYLPSYTEEDLRQVTSMDESQFTELPSTVPQRVKDLAVTLTKGQPTYYDQVKAIERYFQSDDFTYETEDVAVPKAGQDYVDQFLFETKKGYCDNYSTSMVVLLRSIGIESRWVKGYRQGDVIRSDASQQVYQVTNANAHSWVEVYFDGYGWVPFEPTKGMVNPIQIPTQQIETTEQSEVQEPPAEQKVEEKQEKQEKQPKEQQVNTERMQWGRFFFIGVIVLLLVGIVVLYWKRKRWLHKLLFARVQNFNSNDTFMMAYERLLVSLKWLKRLKKKPYETDREFAMRIENELNVEELLPLTTTYEKIKYGKQIHESWDVERELYENLVNKILS